MRPFLTPPAPAAHHRGRVGQGFVGQPPGKGNGREGPAEKKYRGLIHGGSGAFGNAANRIEAFIAGSGTYAYGSYADIDGLFREQASEVDPKRREATLHRIQPLVHDKVMVAPT
jgi:hypothetical protein